MNLYYCKIDELRDLAGVHLLPEERRRKMERYRREDDKARCLIAGLLLRMVFGEESFRIKNTEKGKLYLPNGLRFNLSHSGDYVILGVSDHELGVDIEKVKKVNDLMVHRSFTEEECQWLYEQCDSEAFYQLWTAKESIMKATGLGFSLPIQSFSVLPVRDGMHRICERDWCLNWRGLPGYVICTACAAKEEITMMETKREQLLK